MSKNILKPFVKWVGGKGQSLKDLRDNLPKEFDTYIEPFLGGGALLFDILAKKPDLKRVIVNDNNYELICVYNLLRDRAEFIIQGLKTMEKEYLELDEEGRKEMFYKIREKYNKLSRKTVSLHAMYFIFLNKTCFNGLYRVNKDGQFNSPAGRYKNPKICDAELLRAVSKALKNVSIYSLPYEHMINLVDENTFVYCDPPYRPITKTSAFTSYTTEGFSDEDQVKLKRFCDAVGEKGGKVMVSNSDPKSVDENDNFFDDLYEGYNICRINAKRSINSKGEKRGQISELLIKNY